MHFTSLFLNLMVFCLLLAGIIPAWNIKKGDHGLVLANLITVSAVGIYGMMLLRTRSLEDANRVDSLLFFALVASIYLLASAVVAKRKKKEVPAKEPVE